MTRLGQPEVTAQSAAGVWPALLSAALLAGVVAAAWWSEATRSARKQTQPVWELQQFYLPALSAATTQTYFDGVDALAGSLQLTDTAALLAPADTLAVLDAIAKPLLAHKVPAASVQRAGLLLTKSLPGEHGIRLATLLPGYLCYLRGREAQQGSQLVAAPAVAPETSVTLSLRQQRQLHAAEVSIREACLGSAASRHLFAEQDRLLAQLLQRAETLVAAPAMPRAAEGHPKAADDER